MNVTKTGEEVLKSSTGENIVRQACVPRSQHLAEKINLADFWDRETHCSLFSVSFLSAKRNKINFCSFASIKNARMAFLQGSFRIFLYQPDRALISYRALLHFFCHGNEMEEWFPQARTISTRSHRMLWITCPIAFTGASLNWHVGSLPFIPKRQQCSICTCNAMKLDPQQVWGKNL